MYNNSYLLKLLFISYVITTTAVYAQQQAQIQLLNQLVKGVETYSDTSICSFQFIVIGPIETPPASLKSTCSFTATPGNPLCFVNNIFNNDTHFSIMGSVSLNSNAVAYADFKLRLIKSDNAPFTVSLVNKDTGLPFTYKCEDPPPYQSNGFSVIATLSQNQDTFNRVDNYESNIFFIYLKVTPNHTVRPVNLAFLNNLQDYSFIPYYIDLDTILLLVQLSDDYQNINTEYVKISFSFNSNEFIFPSPYKKTSTIVLNSFTQFSVPTQWGYYLDTTVSSNDKFPAINLLMRPLHGNSTLDLKFYTQGFSMTPRKIENLVKTPFITSFPAAQNINIQITSSGIETTKNFINIDFKTNGRFSTMVGESSVLPRTSSYPYGLISYDGNTRLYRIPVNYNPALTTFKYYVYSPDMNYYASTLTPTIGDTRPPSIEQIVIILLNETHSVLRIRASDDSGVRLIRTNYADLTKRNLVVGTSLDGFYEAIIPCKKSLIATEITIEDYAGIKAFYSPQELNFKYELEYPQQNDLYRFTSFFFSNNQVDVTLNDVDVILYLNISQTQLQLDEYTSLSLTIYFTSENTQIVYGVYNKTSQLYQFPFNVPSKLTPGLVRYIVSLNGQTYESFLLIGKFKENAKLQIINNGTIDSVFPIVTLLTQINDQSDPLVWDFEFYDISGIKKIIIGITSEYDVQGKNFTIDANGETTLQRRITYVVNPSTCRPMKYWISYIYTEDVLGHVGETFRYSNTDFHPFFKYDGETTDVITLSSTYCTQNILDTTPPTIISLSISSATNTSIQNEQAQVIFKVTDGTMVSIDHMPVCYFTGTDNELVSSLSTIVKIQSGIVDFSCSFIFPFDFGPQALLSIYGLSDIYFNFIGFSPFDLNSDGHPNLYMVPGFGSLITIESTSSLEETLDVFYIYGRGYLQGTLNVEVQTDYETLLLNPNITSGSVLVLYDMIHSSEYKVKIHIGQATSNTVTLKGPLELSSSSSSQSSSSSDTHSSSEVVTPVPQSCKTDCGAPLGYGVCKGTTCICNIPHSGLDCLSTIATNTSIEPNINNPSVNITLSGNSNGNSGGGSSSTFSSFIQLVSLREYDTNRITIVSNHLFNNDKWINIPSDSIDNEGIKTTSYKYIIDNTLNTTIYSTVQVFSQAKTIQFGKQQLQMNPSTVKFTFNVTSYPFTKSTNTLQLIMSASVESNQDTGCSYQEFIQDQNDSQYLVIQIDQVSLFGRFIGYAIIDGRDESITNTKIDKLDQITLQQSSSKSKSLIGLNIRYFKQNALLDPDFSVLIDSKSARDQVNSICTSSPSSSKLSSAQIAGIVVGGVVFLFIVGALIIYFLSKKSSNPIIYKLRNITKH